MMQINPLSYDEWQNIGAKLRHAKHTIMCSKCYVTIITDEEGWYFPQDGDFWCPKCWIEDHKNK